MKVSAVWPWWSVADEHGNAGTLRATGDGEEPLQQLDVDSRQLVGFAPEDPQIFWSTSPTTSASTLGSSLAISLRWCVNVTSVESLRCHADLHSW